MNGQTVPMSDRTVSRSRVINASPEAIFAVLSSPAGHQRIDGSGTVRGAIEGPDPLTLGDRFRMNMRMGVPYKMWSEVKEYEENQLIAWAHFGKHRWRFELEAVDGGTKVTHTFDWSTAISPVKAPHPLKLQCCGVTITPADANFPMHDVTCSGDVL